MEGTFVGRDAELATLTGTVRRAWQLRVPAVALVVGEGGCGKTRLLAETEKASPAGHVLHVAGREPERAIPLAASRPLLLSLAAVPDIGDRLAQLVFGVPSGEDELDRLRVLEAAHKCCAALGPALLVIDDLQWTDELTRALLHYLIVAAAAAGLPLAVVIGSRPSPIAGSLMASLRRDVVADGVTWLDLLPLSREAGIRLAQELDRSLDEPAAEALWRATGGVPFWLVQHRHGADAGDATRLVSERLQSLPLDAASVLAVLAVAGRPLSLDDVAAVREWPVARVEPAARSLLDGGLVRSVGAALELAHDLIREGAVGSLAAAERRTLHRRLADHLEAASGGDVMQLREVLQHRLAAGVPAADVALRLLEAPRRRLLGLQGLHELAAVADEESGDDLLAVRLQERLASLAADLGEERIACDRWQLVADSSADEQTQVRALSAAARAAVRLGDADRAADLIIRARRPTVTDPATAVDVDAAAATVACWAQRSVAEGAGLAQKAVAAARAAIGAAGGIQGAEPGLRRAYVTALSARYGAAQMLNEDTALLRIADELIGASVGLGRSHFQARVQRAAALRYVGRTRDAETALEPLWNESRERILPSAALQIGWELATARYQLGLLTGAATVAEEAQELGARGGHFVHRANLRRLLLRLRLHSGDWTAAIRALEDEAATESDPHLRSGVHDEIATWMARLRGPAAVDQVAGHIEAAWEDHEAVGCRRCGTHLRLHAVEALARVGRSAAAAQILAGAEQPVVGSRVLVAFWRQWAAGILARADGSAEAVPLLRSVVADADARGWRLDAVWARLDLAQAVDDPGEATSLTQEAARTAAAAGALTEQRLAEQQLRAAGMRTWRRTSATPADVGGLTVLSRREREIAELVATGASNPQIAAALFLSRKTVERHITNVLAKVGLRNRTELAAMVTVERAQDGGAPG